jgi:hypothetical protein
MHAHEREHMCALNESSCLAWCCVLPSPSLVETLLLFLTKVDMMVGALTFFVSHVACSRCQGVCQGWWCLHQCRPGCPLRQACQFHGETHNAFDKRCLLLRVWVSGAIVFDVWIHDSYALFFPWSFLRLTTSSHDGGFCQCRAKPRSDRDPLWQWRNLLVEMSKTLSQVLSNILHEIHVWSSISTFSGGDLPDGRIPSCGRPATPRCLS